METHNFNAIIHLARRCLHKQIEKLFQQLSLYTSLCVSLSHTLCMRFVSLSRQRMKEKERGRQRASMRRPSSSSTNRFRTTEVLKAATDRRKSRQIEGQAHKPTGKQRWSERERERDRQTGREVQADGTYTCIRKSVPKLLLAQ